MIERGFRLADLRRDGAIADRLARLLFQRFHLPGQLADDILDTQQVGFRSLQPQLRLMAAGMQTGDAGGFFQHAAALFGLGLDDLADAPLMHQSRRARPGRGVGEYHLHVAGADFAAIDTIGRAGFALDAASDFQHIGVVEMGWRRTLRIVDRDRHFGVAAGRAGV